MGDRTAKCPACGVFWAGTHLRDAVGLAGSSGFAIVGNRSRILAGIYGAAVGSDVGRRRLGAWRSVNAEKPLAGTPPGRVEFCRLDDRVLLEQDQVARAGFPGKERAADSAGGHENGPDLKLPGGCVPSAQEGSLRDARPAVDGDSVPG